MAATDLQRRTSTRAKRETLPSTFPKELLRNPFGLPIPVESTPPVPRLSMLINPGSLPKSPTATSPTHSLRPPVVHAPPKAPLPPHKLAAIANALGVHAHSPGLPSAGPKPSSPASSRFLLHVIPPECLMPADDDDEEELQSPFSRSAPGYHGQFARGIMVPLHPTLASQLGAIAREYGLPSSGGLILYLFSNGEPGPRISDEAWKTLWHKSLRHERDHPQSKDQGSPQSSYPSPASSDAHGSTISTLDIPIPSSLNLPIIAKVEFDIDRRKATWFSAFSNARGLRGRPSTPASIRSESQFPLPLRLRSRNGSFESRGRADTGSTARSQHSLSSSDKAAADDEVRGVTTRARVGLGIESTPSRKPPPHPLKFAKGKGGGDGLSDSPIDLDEEDSPSHLAYRILIDGPPEGDDDDFHLGAGSSTANRRASHLLMKDKLDSLEKAMHQFSPRVDKFDGLGGTSPSLSAGTPSPASPSPARSTFSSTLGRTGLPSPEAFGEPPGYSSTGLPGSVPAGSTRFPQSAGPATGSFNLNDTPPRLTINGMQREQIQQSPGYSMSSDPFAAKPSFGAAGEAIQTGATSVSPPPRDESLPGSRFSQDSLRERAASTKAPETINGRERTNSTAGPKGFGFKRLWRKSSASGMNALTGGKVGAQQPLPPPMPPMSPMPMSPLPGAGGSSMSAQQAAFIAAQQSGPSKGSFSSQQTMVSQSASSATTPQSPVPSLGSESTNANPKRGSDIDPFIFDQESTRYPTIRSGTPSNATYSTSATSVSTNGSVGKKAGGGIMKGWGMGGARARSGSVSTANSIPGVSTSMVPLPSEGMSPVGFSPASEDGPRMPPGARARTPTMGKRASGQTLQNFLSEDPQSSAGTRPPTKPGNYF